MVVPPETCRTVCYFSLLTRDCLLDQVQSVIAWISFFHPEEGSRLLLEHSILIYVQQDATLHSLLYTETALHVSGGTSTHHQERKQLYLQHLVFVTPLLLSAAIVIDDGWRYHPKHVEQFPDKINCVTLHLVGYILEYYYDARNHER